MCLEIIVGNDEQKAIQLNYSKIMSKVKSTLSRWKRRSLSLIGKVSIVNSLIASLFVYPMTNLSQIPDKVVQDTEADIEKFIWAGHKPKIPLRTLMQPKSNGGLGLINLTVKDKALKAQWVNHIFEDSQLFNSVSTLLDLPLGMVTWRCNLKGL